MGVIAVLFFLHVFPAFFMIDWFVEQHIFPWLNGDNVPVLRYFVIAFPVTTVLIVITILVSAILRWLILPRLKFGLYPVDSHTYCSKWLVSHIQDASMVVFSGLFATVCAPLWFRLLGAKVGSDAKISTRRE